MNIEKEHPKEIWIGFDKDDPSKILSVSQGQMSGYERYISEPKLFNQYEILISKESMNTLCGFTNLTIDECVHEILFSVFMKHKPLIRKLLVDKFGNDKVTRRNGYEN